MDNIKKQTILIVDDTPENIDLLVEILNPYYEVKVANNGERAIKIARSFNKPDLVLLDIMMPRMDGYEVCRILKNDIATKHIPIIFLTAMAAAEDEKKGFDVGALDYITKPISAAIVLARVKTHLSLYDQERTLIELVNKKTAELNETRLEIIRTLGRAAEFKDNDTGFHVIRMSYYSYLIAKAMGLEKNAAEIIFNASPMHDVGKIGIPDSILKKPGKLDAEEWEIMKTHSSMGADIIGEHESELLKLAKVISMTHHEKWDGTGYPLALKSEEIPIAARIVAVADVFDALTSIRPYKKPWAIEEAVEEIKKSSGSHFDPTVVQAFLKVVPEISEIRDKYKDGVDSIYG